MLRAMERRVLAGRPKATLPRRPCSLHPSISRTARSVNFARTFNSKDAPGATGRRRVRFAWTSTLLASIAKLRIDGCTGRMRWIAPCQRFSPSAEVVANPVKGAIHGGFHNFRTWVVM